MIYKSQGIILHSIKFGESSLITKVYTKNAGLISLMARSVRKSKNRNNQAFFQALNQVEIVYYHKSKEGLANLKEIKIVQAYERVHTDIEKMSIGMFLAEVILKAVREEEENPNLYAFIEDALWQLDANSTGLANFHLVFIIRLAHFLGIIPQNNFNAENCFFDIEEGKFRPLAPMHFYFLDEANSKLLSQLISSSFSENHDLKISRENRKILLNAMMEYYKTHLSGFGNIQSLQVLEDVFNAY